MAAADNECTRTHFAYMGFERCMNCKWVIRKQSKVARKKRPLIWLVI